MRSNRHPLRRGRGALLAGPLLLLGLAAAPADADPEPPPANAIVSNDGVRAVTLSLCGLVYVVVQPLTPTNPTFQSRLPMTVSVRDPLRNLDKRIVTRFDIGAPTLTTATASPVLFPADLSGRGPGTIIDLDWPGGTTSLQTENYTDNCEGSFEPTAPTRVLDTRTGAGRPAAGAVPRFTTIDLDLEAALPRAADGVTAAVLNVTVTNPTEGGFVTAYPCGGALPTASNVNFAAGETAPNLVVVDLVGRTPNGHVCIFTSATTDLIADLTGAFVNYDPPFTQTAPGAMFTALEQPQRLLDTRASGEVAANTSVQIPTAGRNGLPASGVRAVAMNITATGPQTAGYLTVYPCGSAIPNASNLNFVEGETRPNAAVVQVGPAQDVCVYASTATHVIVDVMGYYAPSSGTTFWGHVPTRLFDSRTMTVPGNAGPRKLAAGSAFVYPSVINVAGDVVSLNVTATGADADGYLSVYPCAQGIPATSNLNVAVGRTIANAVTVRVDQNRSFCVFASVDVHVIIDQSGSYFIPR